MKPEFIYVGGAASCRNCKPRREFPKTLAEWKTYDMRSDSEDNCGIGLKDALDLLVPAIYDGIMDTYTQATAEAKV